MLPAAFSLFFAAVASAAVPTPAPPPAAVPDTDIFIADLHLAGETAGEQEASGGALAAGAPRNLTARPGYDNQPAFLPDGTALLYVARDDSTGTTDVWRVDLATGVHARVTATPEAEYSPTPLADGSGFSAVRVEAPHAEGEAFTESQRLFKYGYDGRPVGAILGGVRRVGYHAWIDATRVALFIVGNDESKIPHTLVLADIENATITPLARDIGRSLGRSPEGQVTFVDQTSPSHWSVATIAVGDTVATALVPVPAGPVDEKPQDRSQDFCWLADGSLLMANGNRLLRWRRDAPRWTTVAEFRDLPGRIRRLAVSRDGTRVAFVVDMPARP